jgi:hypothetical protein
MARQMLDQESTDVGFQLPEGENPEDLARIAKKTVLDNLPPNAQNQNPHVVRETTLRIFIALGQCKAACKAALPGLPDAGAWCCDFDIRSCASDSSRRYGYWRCYRCDLELGNCCQSQQGDV